jgi:ArsR family transcriptional regulator
MSRPETLFHAFGDQTRLRLLRLLSEGETCVCDLMAVLKQPQSKVSRHLGYLRRAGLVADRRQGRWRYYALARPNGRLHARLLACVGSCFNDAPAFRRDAAALKSLARRGGVCAPSRRLA